MKSNVSVGPPIDVFCYEAESLRVNLRTRLDEDDAYLQEISDKWQDGLVRLVNEMPSLKFAKPVGYATAA
jgi:putative proteasome-type protease